MLDIRLIREQTAFVKAELGKAGVDGAEIDLAFQLPRQRLRVCTVDLGKPWQDVHSRLLSIAGA